MVAIVIGAGVLLIGGGGVGYAVARWRRERRRKASPMGREGSGWDIGNAVVFLASDRARFITGQTLVVDGGATLMGPPRHT